MADSQVKTILGEESFRNDSRCIQRLACPTEVDIQKLNQFLARLQKLSEEFNLAVLLTNQVQADPGVCD